MSEAVYLSPPDERDYRVCMAMDVAGVEIPEEFEVWQPPVENQGQVGNCVAQTLANIMECIEHKKTGEHKDYSVGYIYGLTDMIGMIPRSACDGLIKEGDVYRSVWECLEENPACFRKRAMARESVKDSAKRPLEYIRITTKEELQRFMMKYELPVMIVINYGTGRHAVACRGWRNALKAGSIQDIHFTNSYGTGGGFGDGTGWIKFDEILEIWGIVPMSKTYTDVENTRWSYQAIQAASDAGILTGYEDGTFRPDKTLTREEMAAVIQRMLNYCKANFQSE